MMALHPQCTNNIPSRGMLTARCKVCKCISITSEEDSLNKHMIQWNNREGLSSWAVGGKVTGGISLKLLRRGASAVAAWRAKSMDQISGAEEKIIPEKGSRAFEWVKTKELFASVIMKVWNGEAWPQWGLVSTSRSVEWWLTSTRSVNGNWWAPGGVLNGDWWAQAGVLNGDWPAPGGVLNGDWPAPGGVLNGDWPAPGVLNGDWPAPGGVLNGDRWAPRGVLNGDWWAPGEVLNGD